MGKRRTTENIYKVMMPTTEHQPKTKQLQKNTHTRNEMFPPIVVKIDKSHLFRPQP